MAAPILVGFAAQACHSHLFHLTIPFAPQATITRLDENFQLMEGRVGRRLGLRLGLSTLFGCRWGRRVRCVLRVVVDVLKISRTGARWQLHLHPPVHSRWLSRRRSRPPSRDSRGRGNRGGRYSCRPDHSWEWERTRGRLWTRGGGRGSWGMGGGGVF
jgi:hypothetical protein